MLSKNEALSRGQLWHELNWNTSFEIVSNHIFYHVNYMIFLLLGLTLHSMKPKFDYCTHCPHVRLKMLFLTFLHTPKSNYDTLTDSLMISYSSHLCQTRCWTRKKKKKKNTNKQTNVVGIVCCFDTKYTKLFIQVR